MSILDEILSSLTNDSPVMAIDVGPRVTAVWSNHLGLAIHLSLCESTEPQTLLRQSCAIKIRHSARELAYDFIHSSNSFELSISVATISSLLYPKPDCLLYGSAYPIILSRGEAKNVTLVGHFAFAESLRNKVRNLWVLELNPQKGDLPASAAEYVIPQSDVVVITGSTLVNRTLDNLLTMARGKYVILLGMSTILSPILFDYGVSALGGAIATNPEVIMSLIKTGSSLRRTDGLHKVIMVRDKSHARIAE